MKGESKPIKKSIKCRNTITIGKCVNSTIVGLVTSIGENAESNDVIIIKQTIQTPQIVNNPHSASVVVKNDIVIITGDSSVKINNDVIEINNAT